MFKNFTSRVTKKKKSQFLNSQIYRGKKREALTHDFLFGHSLKTFSGLNKKKKNLSIESYKIPISYQ